MIYRVIILRSVGLTAVASKTVVMKRGLAKTIRTNSMFKDVSRQQRTIVK